MPETANWYEFFKQIKKNTLRDSVAYQVGTLEPHCLSLNLSSILSVLCVFQQVT